MSLGQKVLSAGLALAVALIAAVHAAGAGAEAGNQAPSGGSLERIALNDNRHPAGTLAEGVLTLRLEARAGEWFPDGEGKPGLTVKAFALEGGPPQIPGPLVRVAEGTEIRAVVSNRLQGEALAMHGLYSRPGRPNDATDAVVIPPGEAREVRFVAGTPGTYYYWGATAADTTIDQRAGPDTQLSGAIVVDPRGVAPPADRILVIGNWNIGAAGSPERRFRFVINGRSWPNTERLAYRVGDIVRMRLINAGAAVHPMHLHGFYFNVDSRGDEREDVVYPSVLSARMVVTERLTPGRTFALTWKPSRAGNWLFHCHDNVHLDHGGPLDGAPAAPTGPAHHDGNHALEMMAGPVMGIAVTGASLDPPEPTGARRQLWLTARVDSGGTPDEPAFAYTLDAGAETDVPPSPPFLPGPTILLKRGEPVSITVANQLPEPTAVHWHGIELESYYDGVAGFAGDGNRTAPAIPPGGSFEARFTPPRSGTFIYHTHLNDTRQQQAGLSGPLLVVDDPAAFDREHDLVFLITVPRRAADAANVLINGVPNPPARELRAGRHYRLRFINAHTFRPSMRMRLLRGADDNAPLAWRALAKDGRDLPGDQQVQGPSEIQMGNGETYDFDFVPSEVGEARLDVTAGNGTLLASMPIKVR